ncbi:MAG TPA: hypothetical protein VMR76_02180 [Candidatus Saccharimonadia bacterium]|nr:hypothetical protein [Candidatus Saccharimonadia bacterium]
MSTYAFALLAAFASALCNGTTAVLQKVSADKEKSVSTLDVRLLFRLFQDKPYSIGILLDLLGWVFTLIAVHYLPLFLVAAVIASGVIVTALIERLFRHQKIRFRSYMAILIIVVGLVLLAVASSSQKVRPISDVVRYSILLVPIPIAILGYVLARSKRYKVTIVLGILSGVAFSGTSIVGRIFKFSKPLWHTVYSPLVFSIIASGILGLLLFSIALQRAKATVINASMLTSQTILPATIGIIFFGDVARNGMWYLVVVGILLALIGVTFLALGQETNN